MKTIAITALFCFSMTSAHAAQSGASFSAVMHFDPQQGWSEASESIPGIDTITSMTGSGGTTSWAVGLTGSNNEMSINTGAGWGGSSINIPLPAECNGPINFIPAHPKTGSLTTGWAECGAQVSYFNGRQFEAPVTFSGNPGDAVAVFASSGNAWAILDQAVSTFYSRSEIQHGWMPAEPLPLYHDQSTWYAAAAAGSTVYVLGLTPDATQYALFSVDRKGQIAALKLPAYDANWRPACTQPLVGGTFSGTVVTEGKTLFVLLVNVINQPGKMIFHDTAYYSQDAGNTWTDMSLNMPQVEDSSFLSNIHLVKGIVSIPPSPFKFNNTMMNGAYLSLNQKSTPSWQVFPALDGSSGDGVNVYSNPSSDGAEECLANYLETASAPPLVGCYDFTTNQWSAVPALSADVRSIKGLVVLSNGQVAGTGAADNSQFELTGVTLYYNGVSWSEQTPSGTWINIYLNSSPAPYNAQNIWGWGLDLETFGHPSQ